MTASDRASSADSAPSSKPRKRRARKKRPARGIGARIGRIAYWGLVVGLWLAIGCVGVIAWVGAHLPPIQSLEIPKRPPSIQIVDIQGRALARRGDLAGEPLPLREMPSYVPKAFIAIEDRRFYEHHGVDPFGIWRALWRQRAGRPCRARRFDHHAADGQDSSSSTTSAPSRANSTNCSMRRCWKNRCRRRRFSSFT